MFRGDTLEIDSQFLKSGLPVNLTGYSVTFTVKYAVQDTDSTAIFQGTTFTGDVTVTDVVMGKVKATMPAIKTILFPDTTTTVVYDLQAKEISTSKITTFEFGTIDIYADVTNSI